MQSMRSPIERAAVLAAVIVAVLVSASCSKTYDEKMAEVRGSYYVGSIDAAGERLDALLAEESTGSSDYNLMLLDGAIIDLGAGRAAKAQERLLRVRDSFDEVESAETAAIFGEMGTYFTDDRFKAYPGEDHEKLLIRVLLAFSDLLLDGGDTIAYANQVLEKQRAILDAKAPDRSDRNYKSGYRLIGAGAYLYGLITEERDPTAQGEVRLSYERVKEWEPQFRDAIQADLERIEAGRRLSDGNGAIYVFGFVGKGPRKIEVEERDLAAVSEIALQMTRFIPEVGKYYGATIDLSPIRIHRVVADSTSFVAGLEVDVGGDTSGRTATLTDLTAVALQQYAQVRDWVLAKAVVRRMVKKAVVTAAKGTGRMVVEQNSKDSHRELSAALFEIGGLLANTIWTAMERADTRSWALLPDRIEVLRLEVPAGDHEVTLTPLDRNGARGQPRRVRARVFAGQNTYVFGFVPTPGPGPAPLTNRPASGDGSAVARAAAE